MNTPKQSQRSNDSKQQDQTANLTPQTDDLEDDGTPVLDEADLEENDLTVEEAEDIEWEDTDTLDDLETEEDDEEEEDETI